MFLYYPMIYSFSLIFRKLTWTDPHQVGRIVLLYSVYQIIFCVLTVKNCFLIAQGRPVSAQLSVLFGWAISLSLLWRIHSIQDLSQIPLCLVAGNVLALLLPNLGRLTFVYRSGFFRAHVVSLASRNWPLIIGGSVYRLEPLIDGVLASLCRAGSLTIYFFFGRIMLYMSTITFSGYMQPEQKRLAETVREMRWEVLRTGTRDLAFRAIAISLALLAGGVLTVWYFYLIRFRPATPYFHYFKDDFPVFFLMLGFLLGMLATIAYSNSLYVIREERLFLLTSLCVLPVGIMLKFCGAFLYGLRGLGLGTSLYWILYAGVLVGVFSSSVRKRKSTSAFPMRGPLGKLETGFGPAE